MEIMTGGLVDTLIREFIRVSWVSANPCPHSGQRDIPVGSAIISGKICGYLRNLRFHFLIFLASWRFLSPLSVSISVHPWFFPVTAHLRHLDFASGRSMMQLEVNTVQPGHALNLVVAREESKMNTHVTGELARWMEDDMGAPLNLAPVCPGGLPNSAYEWGCARTLFVKLGAPSWGSRNTHGMIAKMCSLKVLRAPTYTGKVYRQQTGPDASQLSVVLEPREARYAYRPGAVVPFYHSDDDGV